MRVHLVATVAFRPPMTRIVTRSHPCESDTELPMPSKSWRGAFFLFPWASAVEKINANLRSSLPYLRATQRCPKKDIQPRCVLGISLRVEPLHLPPASIFTSLMRLLCMQLRVVIDRDASPFSATEIVCFNHLPLCDSGVVFTTCRIGNYGLVRRHRRAKIAHPAGLLRRLGFEGRRERFPVTVRKVMREKRTINFDDSLLLSPSSILASALIKWPIVSPIISLLF